MQKTNKIKHLFILVYLRKEVVIIGDGNMLPEFQNAAKIHFLVFPFILKQKFSQEYFLVKHPV